MGDFAAGHLKGAVSDEHEGASSAGDLRSQRCGHGKSHRRVVRRRDAFVRADVDAREQRIARVRDQRQLGVLLHELIHQLDDVLHLDLLVLLERIEDFSRHVGAHGLDDVSPNWEIGHQQPVYEHVDGCVLEAVVLDEHLARHAHDQIVLVDAVGRDAKARIADELAEQEQAIR